MGSRRHLLSGLAVIAGAVAVLTTPASAHCLASRRPIAGQLELMRLETEANTALKGYQIQLRSPSCAQVTDLDGAPARLEDVRTVQILTSSPAGEQKLDSLIGENIVVAGYLDAADPARHTGDAVLAAAWLVAVPSRGEGAPAVADDGLPDPGEAGASGPQNAGAPAPAPSTSHTQIAIAGPDGTVRPYSVPESDPARVIVEGRLAKFVTRSYLSGDNLSPEILRAIYAARVSYFGKAASIDDVIKDKLSYYGRWPVRNYTLKPGTLAIRPLRGAASVYELTFEYEFKVTSAGSSRAGTGYARLQVDLADGHGKIVRETGKVIDRR